MICKVTAGDLGKLRFNETDTVNSVLQNIAIILSTPLGTVPMQRDFGVDMRYLDYPAPQAKVLMVAPVREAVERWEPRATVLGVSFLQDENTPERLIACVEVDITNEE